MIHASGRVECVFNWYILLWHAFIWNVLFISFITRHFGVWFGSSIILNMYETKRLLNGFYWYNDPGKKYTKLSTNWFNFEVLFFSRNIQNSKIFIINFYSLKCFNDSLIPCDSCNLLATKDKHCDKKLYINHSH